MMCVSSQWNRSRRLLETTAERSAVSGFPCLISEKCTRRYVIASTAPAPRPPPARPSSPRPTDPGAATACRAGRSGRRGDRLDPRHGDLSVLLDGAAAAADAADHLALEE